MLRVFCLRQCVSAFLKTPSVSERRRGGAWWIRTERRIERSSVYQAWPRPSSLWHVLLVGSLKALALPFAGALLPNIPDESATNAPSAKPSWPCRIYVGSGSLLRDAASLTTAHPAKVRRQQDATYSFALFIFNSVLKLEAIWWFNAI